MNMMNLKQLSATLLAGAAFLGAVINSQAQIITTSYTNSFDTVDKVSSWHHWYDINAPVYNGPLMDWDGTMDNTPGHPGSGSLVYSNTWPGHAAGVNGQGQDVFYGLFAEGGIYDISQIIDASKYESITFDIHVDASSPTNLAGNICTLQVGTFHTNYSFFVVTNAIISTSATNGWTHYVCPINPTTIPGPDNHCAGIAFNVTCYGGPNANLVQGTNTTYFWLDNVQINRAKIKTPPPSLTAITEPVAGLNLFSSTASSDQYQRTNIKLLSNSGVGWLGQTNVTYALTIKNFPSAATYPGYQAHIMITTGPGTAPYLDYADANLIFLDIHQNPNGTAFGAFRYKTNEPGGNAFVYGAGSLGVAGSSTILGTWSLTFNQDTNITVRSPDGTTFNTNITQDAASLFAEPLYVVFGAQPNQPANIGQEVVLANASITNAGTATSVVNDNFLSDTNLDATIWTPLAGAPNTVFVFPLDPGQKLVKWTLPDTGFGLQTTTNLADPNSWTTLTGNEATGSPLVTLSSSGARTVLVPSADLGPAQSFFRLFTRRFTKLQLLMPGETAAPGTASGKTGTPDPQQAGIPFTVTVNAVDANWRLAATADDIVDITSSDATATLPADAALTGGTATFTVTFGTAGTATVTASDVSDATKTANTGTPTTVN